jgi:UDPglucose 6-dehydrogenase
VRAWDPVVDGRSLHGVEIAPDPEAAADGADAVVIVTEWPQLAGVDWAAVGATMQTRILIDGRNMLDPETLRAAGFAYEGIGRAADTGARV